MRPMSVDVRFAVNVAPKAGHPRPAGPGGRGQPRPPRDRGRVARVRVGRRVELTVDGGRRAGGARRRRAARARAPVEPADRGATRSRRSGDVVASRAGVGRRDERRGSASSSSRAANRDIATRSTRSRSPAPSRSMLWHEQASLDGVAAVVLPGRLRVRRLPPRRRHRPVQPGHARRGGVRRPTAGSSSASATASRS